MAEGTDKFLILKSELSKYYNGKRYSWLKFCLFNLLCVEDITNPDYTSLDLFNELHNKGFISSDKVRLLLEISKLSELKGAEELVKQYLKANSLSTDENGLSSYRIKLFKALREVDPQGLKDVISYYNLRNTEITNIWDAVFQLEVDCKLTDEQDKIDCFAHRLPPCAKNILLEKGVILPLTVNSNCNLDFMHGCVEYLEQQLTQIIPFFKLTKLGIKHSKATLCFYMFTNNQEALKKIMEMHLDDNLIKGLATILKPEDQEKFLYDWNTDINVKEYKAYLKMLREKTGDLSNTGQERFDGVTLLVSLEKQNSSSFNQEQQPQALLLLFKLMQEQKEWTISDVDVVHETIAKLDEYFQHNHNITHNETTTGSIVLQLVVHDTEALEELWKMYCDKKLHQGLAPILLTDEDKSEQQLFEITIDEHDYRNAKETLVGTSKQVKRSLSPDPDEIGTSERSFPVASESGCYTLSVTDQSVGSKSGLRECRLSPWLAQ